MPQRGSERITRREFLKAGLGALLLPAALKQRQSAHTALPQRTLPKRSLGRTGARVTILGLGGQRLLDTPGVRDDAVALINRALDLGINYCDTAHDYYPSEVYYGEVMPTRRAEVFLASKTSKRTRDGAWADIQQSLATLKTSQLDLIQLHHLDYREELDTVLRPDGALAALTEARDQGLVRFIGVSSHNSDTLLAALDGFPFDTVLVRVNPLDPIREKAVRRVLPVALARGIGVIAMKVMDCGGLLQMGGDPSTLLRYTLSHSLATAIVGCGSMEDLEKNVAACRRFRPMRASELRSLERHFCGLASSAG